MLLFLGIIFIILFIVVFILCWIYYGLKYRNMLKALDKEKEGYKEENNVG